MIEYIEENNISSVEIYTNGQGYWALYNNETQLTNCLGQGGKVNIYI